MKRKAQPVGGRKEAPLAVVGSKFVGDPQQKQIFTPEDAEYQRYSELIGGYLEKVARWQRILDADVSQKKFEGGRRTFNVFRSDNTPYIVFSSSSMASHDPPDMVLQVTNYTYFSSHTENGNDWYGERFLIRPGQAWKHLLVDPGDGEPLEEVEIDIGSQPYNPITHAPMQHILIHTEEGVKKPGGIQNYRYHRQASFNFVEDTLQVRHKDDVYQAMTDEMVAKLIDTIDSLIPRSTSPTPQPERRAKPELQTPRQLPAPARRTPGR